jgi:hypothetical protein
MRTLLALLIISLTTTAKAQERLSAFPVNPAFSYQLEAGIFRANFPVDMSAFTVFYSRELKDGTLSVSPHVRYIDYLKSGQPVVGVPYYHSPFTWSSPILSFKLSNTSTKTAYLVQAHFDVTKSDANEMPIPVFHAFAQQGELVIENEGWGSLLNPSVNFAVVSNDDCLHPAQRALLLKNHPINNIDAGWEFQIKDEVRELLRHDAIVCVVGVLHYSVKGGGQLSTPFMTAVNLAPPTPGAPLAPSAAYTLRLQVGQIGPEEVAISQAIAPNAPDHFLVYVTADRSGSFAFLPTLVDTDGKRLPLSKVQLDYFRPRSARDATLSYSSYVTVPEAQYNPGQLKPYLRRVAVNPDDSKDIVLFVSEEWEQLPSSAKDDLDDKLKEVFAPLHLKQLRYCIVNVQNECVSSGEVEWAKPASK